MPSRPKLPSIRPSKVKQALERDGWRESRWNGSHLIMTKTGMKFPVPVPMHGKDMPKGTLKSILKRAGLTTEDLTGLLKK